MASESEVIRHKAPTRKRKVISEDDDAPETVDAEVADAVDSKYGPSTVDISEDTSPNADVGDVSKDDDDSDGEIKRAITAHSTRRKASKSASHTSHATQRSKRATGSGSKRRKTSSSSSSSSSSAPERVHLQPHDRLLFLHVPSRRVFEALVTDVEKRKSYVSIDLPTRKRHKTSHKHQQHPPPPSLVADTTQSIPPPPTTAPSIAPSIAAPSTNEAHRSVGSKPVDHVPTAGATAALASSTSSSSGGCDGATAPPPILPLLSTTEGAAANESQPGQPTQPAKHAPASEPCDPAKASKVDADAEPAKLGSDKPKDADDAPLEAKPASGSHVTVTMRLDAYRHLKDFEILSLFRPADGVSLTPPGCYLCPVRTDLWLEVDDVIEIVKQGGNARTDAVGGYFPELFQARVVSANAWQCRISPVHPTQPSSTTSVASLSRHVDDSHVAALPTESGSVTECVPRNTLRFRSFIKRSTLKTSSVQFDLVPSGATILLSQ